MEFDINQEIQEKENIIITKKEKGFSLKNIKNNINVESLKLLIESNQINITEEKNLKYLLSLTLKNKKTTLNDINILNYLNTYLNRENEKIFIDYTFQCCELGKQQFLKIMFEKGININSQNEYGETFLHIAISKGDKILILFLLKYYPNKNIKTFKDQMTVYDYSIEQGEKSIIDLIYDDKNDYYLDDDSLNINNLNNINNENNENNCFYFNDSEKENVGIFQSVKNDICEDNNIECYNTINKKNNIRNTINSSSNFNNDDFFYIDTITEKDGYFEQIKKIENKSISINNNYNNNNDYINIEDEDSIDSIIVKKINKNKSNESESKKMIFEDSLEDYNIVDNNNKYSEKPNDTNCFISYLDDLSKQKLYSTETNIIQKNIKQSMSENINSHTNMTSNLLTNFTGNSGNNNNNINRKNLVLQTKYSNNRNYKKNNNKINFNLNQNELTHLSQQYKSYTNRDDNLNIFESNDLKDNKNNSERISLIYNNYTNKENQLKKNNLEINNFLSEIGISIDYSKYLLLNGFDDLNLLIEQTKNDISITDQNLKEIGFNKPGTRAKFLIHLEEKANLYEFQINKEIVYFSNNLNENKLYRLLSSINLEHYLNNFLINDYTSPELLYIQMISRQPLTENILLNDIGIDKVGYRMRLINKLKNESNNFIYKIKNGILANNNFHFKKSSIIIESQKGNNNELCNLCLIF
jgi:hypothetical protein